MKKSTIQISFPTEKLDAVRHYMNEKNADMSAEMEDAMQKLYEKHVPREVRSYLETRESAAPEKPQRPARQTPPQAVSGRPEATE